MRYQNDGTYLGYGYFLTTDSLENQFIYPIPSKLIFFVYPDPKGSEENQFTLRQMVEDKRVIDLEFFLHFIF
jgi:hypothetical protein